jgi:hypothetical protein
MSYAIGTAPFWQRTPRYNLGLATNSLHGRGGRTEEVQILCECHIIVIWFVAGIDVGIERDLRSGYGLLKLGIQLGNQHVQVMFFSIKALDIDVHAWGDNSVVGCRSCSRAKGPGTSVGAFPVELSLSGENTRGPRRGAKGSCGTPGTPWVSSPGSRRRSRAAALLRHASRPMQSEQSRLRFPSRRSRYSAQS